MCSNYRPVTASDRLLRYFGVERELHTPPADVYPLGMAPFVRLTTEGEEGGQPALVSEEGMFGLLPNFAAEVKYGRRSYNARSETVAKLATFKHAWSAGQRCVIPADAIYEPNWETGKAVRWRIALPDNAPMGIAGIYRRWRNPAGGELYTFAMLTVNADEHPVMQRFHRPGDEKRMVVILEPAQYMAWLSCSVAEAPRYFQRWLGPLEAEPAPMARAPRIQPDPPEEQELF